MANEAQAHGQANALAEFIPAFFSATFENWQSEFLQLFSMVVLMAFLILKGSHESKDQDNKVDEALIRIERRLERIEQGQRRPHHANGEVDVFLDRANVDTLVALGTSKTPMGEHQRVLGLDRLPLSNEGRGARAFRTG